MELSQTERMRLMSRMTGPWWKYPMNPFLHITPGFDPMRDKAPCVYRVLGEIMGLEEEAEDLLRNIPDEPILLEGKKMALTNLTNASVVWPPMTDAEVERIRAEFESAYQGNPSSPAVLLPVSVGFVVEAEIATPPSGPQKPAATFNGFPVVITDYLPMDRPVNLSPREEALLGEAPVFRTRPLEFDPQPDVIVKPKETQC